MVSENNAEFVT